MRRRARSGVYRPMTEASFSSLGLSSESLAALSAAGYRVPTRSRPGHSPALGGKDVIGCAATGTGKTAASVLPLVERLAGKQGTRALILAHPRAGHADRRACRPLRRGPGCPQRAPHRWGEHRSPAEGAALPAPAAHRHPGRLIDHLDSCNVSSPTSSCWCSTRPTGCWTWASSPSSPASWPRCLVAGRRCSSRRPWPERWPLARSHLQPGADR